MTCRTTDEPCRECPFRRKSLPGYLGESSGKPHEFLMPHWMGQEIPLPCHMTINWERPDREAQIADAPLCRGWLTMMKNACKRPIDPQINELMAGIRIDTENVFQWPQEFIDYHQREETKDGNEAQSG